MDPSADDTEVLASRVSRRRADLGLTQQEAADRAGVAVTTWRMIEGGSQTNFRALTLAAVARALGLEVDHLLDPSTTVPAITPGSDMPSATASRDNESLASMLAEQMSVLPPRDLLLIQALVGRLAEDRS